jgi:hypothetical protein
MMFAPEEAISLCAAGGREREAEPPYAPLALNFKKPPGYLVGGTAQIFLFFKLDHSSNQQKMEA